MIRTLVLLLAGGMVVAGLLLDSVFLLPIAAILLGIALGMPATPTQSAPATAPLLLLLEQERWALLLVGAIVAAFAAGWIDQTFPAHWGALIVWFAALILVGVAVYVHDRRPRIAGNQQAHSRSPVFNLTHWEWLGVLAITTLALWLRVYRLDQMLPYYHGDEGELGLCALQSLQGDLVEFQAKPLPFFATSCFNMPTLFYYIQAFALWMSGATSGSQALVVLRVLSAVFGAMCVPLVYLIGRVGWGKIAGFVAAALIAFAHLHIHYSRMALNNIQSVWFALFCALMLIAAYEQSQRQHTDAAQPPENPLTDDPLFDPTTRAASNTKPITNQAPKAGLWGRIAALLPTAHPNSPSNAPVALFAWLGTGVGLSLYFYFGSQLIPVITVPLLVWMWWKRSLNGKQLLVVMATFLVTFAPLLIHYTQKQQGLTGRSGTVFLLSKESLTGYLGPDYSWTRDVPVLLWRQAINLARLFIDRGDISSFYTADTPGLDWITAGLFWMGLGIVLVRLLRYPESVLLFWFVAGCTLAGILTRDAPTVTRLIVALPPAYLIAGIAAQSILGPVTASPTLARLVVPLILVPLLATAGWLNYTAYFDKYARIMAYMAPGRIAMQVEGLNASTQAFLIGDPRLYANHGVLHFINRDAELYDLKSAADFDTLRQEHPTDKPKLLFVFLPERTSDLVALQARFPNATVEEHKDNLDRLLYYSLLAIAP